METKSVKLTVSVGFRSGISHITQSLLGAVLKRSVVLFENKACVLLEGFSVDPQGMGCSRMFILRS